jgi:hypothetical protein
MKDVRKILVVLVIAVLYGFFVFSLIEAVFPSPKYEDFCGRRAPVMPRNIDVNCTEFRAPKESQEACIEQEGFIEYEFSTNGCAVGYKCNTCQNELERAREGYSLMFFILSAFLGLIAVALGLYLPVAKEINQWIASGFMLGGLASLFIGTVRYYEDMIPWLRPIVIFLEIALVIFVSRKKLNK